MQKTIKFIALDLETTGLDPQKDTIIEIAAIKWEIEKNEDWFLLKNIEEKTSLINPQIPLEEEVTLITKISEKMLEGKPTWDEVKDKVQDFISEDTVILGHNVLFDVEVLYHHGINLKNRNIIDTFEFSEIFSQNAESLNLGFLADFYEIEKRWQEHRALTDTWIAVDLFMRYLAEINNLKNIEKSIWQQIALNKKSPISFLKIFWENEEVENLENWAKKYELNQENIEKKSDKIAENENFKIFSLNTRENSEINLIKKFLEEKWKIQILTRNKKISSTLEKKLEKQWIKSKIWHNKYEFVAWSEIINEALNSQNLDRKYRIFLIKMMFWLYNTKTWLLSELKYYGEEYNFLENFRLEENEKNFFWENYQKSIEDCKVIIENFNKNTKISDNFSLFKDISLFEETIREARCIEIDIEKLIKNTGKINSKNTAEIIDFIRFLEAFYTSVPDRPTGENPIPPGKYGETYFFKQNDLWHRGCKWLSLANRRLFEIFENWKNETENLENRNQKIMREKIIKDIEFLISYQTQDYENIGVILTIINEKTNLKFIERNLDESIKNFWKNSVGYGYWLEIDEITNFVKRELNNENIEIITENNNKKITKFLTPKEINFEGKTLILTTNMKHIREIWWDLEWKIGKILLQWTSGGKSKMTHYFLEENTENTVLVGTIDNWANEWKIFEKINRVIIAKIPFDPPTDPYFLAKAGWVSNSFELYSKPVVLSKLNSMIGFIAGINSNVDIICTDDRLNTTEWGKFIKNNLI